MSAKKTKKAEKVDEKPEQKESEQKQPLQQNLPPIPKEMEEKLKDIKDKLDKFKSKILEKFDKYIMGIELLPPEPQPAPGQQLPPMPGQPQMPQPIPSQSPMPFQQPIAGQSPSSGQTPPLKDDKRINLLILIDDSDVKKMTKWELQDKLVAIMDTTAKEIDERIKPNPLLLSDLWQSVYDGKYDLLKTMALGAPIYDTGMMGAIKIAEVHKTMILKKFEKYIVAYVLAGSLTQGKATASSDIDVWIVIDDTDVKKMSRLELKDKLRAIIIGMGVEAGEITGIKNKINIQVYILTDFWDSLREANPVIFTLLRDGVPFYDRGIFMPWKQLLQMGKIKPSREAIDLFMSTGDQMLQRVKFKLKDIGMEDIYYAILTPSQAALMMQGIPPPTPRETPEMMREIFVKRQMLEEKFVKILENNITIRKQIEHGDKKELSGKEVDQLLSDAEKYLERVQKLFKQIEKTKEEESMIDLYDRTVTVIRDVLKSEGMDRIEDEEVVRMFEDELTDKGKVPASLLRDLNEVMQAKKDFDKGKLTKAEIEKARQGSEILIRTLIEYLQRKKSKELERAKVRIKYGNHFAEVLMLDTHSFIVHDIEAEQSKVSKTQILENGGFGPTHDSSFEELEKALVTAKFSPKAFRQPMFEKLRELFGKDVEILLN